MTDFEKAVIHLQTSGDEDWEMAERLFKSKDYAYSLFFCHLALEKFLKAAVVVKTNAPAPYTHFLARLAEMAELPINESQIASLKTITRFNISGRYDNEKRTFRKLATKEYAQEYFNITQGLILWLKNNYLKK